MLNLVPSEFSINGGSDEIRNTFAYPFPCEWFIIPYSITVNVFYPQFDFKISPELRAKLEQQLSNHEIYQHIEARHRVDTFLGELFLTMTVDFLDTLETYSKDKNKQVFLLRVMINSALINLDCSVPDPIGTLLAQLQLYNTSKILRDINARFESGDRPL